MGHHSYMTIGRREYFLASRDGYDSELAALFQEGDRVHLQEGEDEEDPRRYGYFAHARQLRQRLHVQGFTAPRALADLKAGIEKWHNSNTERRFRNPGSDVVSPPELDSLLDSLRLAFAEQRQSNFEDWNQEQKDDERANEINRIIDELRWYMDTRSLLRLLLEPVPDGAEVGLALHELTGCCVELDAKQPIAEMARASQLREVSTNAPLIVLTEGRTDSRLLQSAMSVTHPHLVGFVKFIDFDGVGGAEGSVSALSKTVYAFIAAGVANRFVAIADNDTEGHAGLDKLKREKLPYNCRVTHYPDLPMLANYPTIGPYSHDPVLADVNGRAGCIEMYFGRDVLVVKDRLAPVQWRSYNPKLERYHGTLMDSAKKAAQDAFEEKIRKAIRKGYASDSEDWTGVSLIIEHIIHIFD